MKVVRYTCFSWLNVNRPLQDATEFYENLCSPDSRAPNPGVVVLQNDSDTLMRKALEKLPLNFREVFILRELEGTSYREIAEITGMPTGTVTRARDKIDIDALAALDNCNKLLPSHEMTLRTRS